MTTLLEQAFTAATQLSQERQTRPQHQQINKTPAQKNPLQIFTELGLVGCFEGEPDLSTNYETVKQSV